MNRYLILLREQENEEGWEKIEANAETMEEAIRVSLEDEQIWESDWFVYEVTDAAHSSDFHHDGIFDDIQPGEKQ